MIKLVDDPKKKRLDAKRVALSQPWEVRHLKKSAKELLEKLQIDANFSKKQKTRPIVDLFNKKGDVFIHRTEPLIKICKALLKFIEREKCRMKKKKKK